MFDGSVRAHQRHLTKPELSRRFTIKGVTLVVGYAVQAVLKPVIHLLHELYHANAAVLVIARTGKVVGLI